MAAPPVCKSCQRKGPSTPLRISDRAGVLNRSARDVGGCDAVYFATMKKEFFFRKIFRSGKRPATNNGTSLGPPKARIAHRSASVWQQTMDDGSHRHAARRDNMQPSVLIFGNL